MNLNLPFYFTTLMQAKIDGPSRHRDHLNTELMTKRYNRKMYTTVQLGHKQDSSSQG